MKDYIIVSKFFKKNFIFILPIFYFLFSFDLHGKYNITADFTLNNGLRVICIEKKTVPIVACIVHYKCGSVDDAPSKSGVAHYLEHMAFCSQKGELADFLESIGAEFNAFTSNKMVCFYEIFPKEHLEKILKYESNRMQTLDINQEKFLSEKGAILEERSMRCDNSPSGQATETIMATLFNRSSGGIHTIGWRNEIESIQPQDLIDFHNKWFAPNNALIILVGDIDLKTTRLLIEKYFGEIKPKKINRKIEIKRKPEFIKEVTLKSVKVQSASADYFYFVPFDVKSDFRKSIALELVTQILNQPKSLIRKTLYENLKKVTSVSFIYDYGSYLFDTLIVTMNCSSVNNLDYCEKIWVILKDKLIINGVTEEELKAVKRQSLLANAYKKDDISLILIMFSISIATGRSIEQIQNYDATVQSITVQECNQVLKEVLSSPHIAILKLLPKEHDRD